MSVFKKMVEDGLSKMHPPKKTDNNKKIVLPIFSRITTQHTQYQNH